MFFSLTSLICLYTFSYVYGGTKCPDRAEIYPCICIDKQIGKNKYETTLVCQSLTHGGSLQAIEEGMHSTEFDKFLLYDSYWSNHERLLQINARIPINYISSFKTSELKVVDTKLSSFGCAVPENCRTSYLKRFTAINSTVTENSACSNHSSISSWISCPGSIEFIEINKGYASHLLLKADFFPDTLTRLKVLRMPYNQIVRIEKRTFPHTKFPALDVLDLSHNFIRDIRNPFSSLLLVKHLDLSYNSIRVVLDFQYLPELKSVNLSKNHIISLLQSEWTNIPESIRMIDLTSNNLDCNCGTKWVNSTFHISTSLIGQCLSPPQVANMKIRRASRLLNQRCDDQGQILDSNIQATTTPAE